MPEKRINYKELGTTGLRRYGGYVYEEFLPQLRWPRAADIFQEMADNDPVVGSILYLAETLIRGAGWDVEPNSDSEVDIKAAEFLKSCMYDMDTTWANTICEILSMFTYGFSFHEVVYKVRRGPFETSERYRSKFSDGKIGWRRMPIRSQHSLVEWEFDEKGNILAFIQQALPDYKTIKIPLSKGLLFRTNARRDNPEGRSLLRNTYRPWYFKKHFEELEGIGIERDLAGLPVLTAPENYDLWDATDPTMVSLRAKAEALVSSIRRDSEEGVILPHGWDLKLLSSTSSRQISVGEAIERNDKRIAITLLSDIVLMGDKSGSFALGEVKENMLGDALQAQLDNIADTFNGKAVPALFSVNSFTGITGYPKIVPGKIKLPDIKEIALILRAGGIKMGIDIELDNYIRKICGLPIISEERFKEVFASKTEEETEEPVDAYLDRAQRNDTAERDFEQNDAYYV